MNDEVTRINAAIQQILADINAGDLHSANAKAEVARNEFADFADIHHISSRIFSALKDDARAIEMMEIATKKSDANPNYFIDLGDLNLAAGRLDDAQAAYQKYLDTENPPSLGYVGLARVYEAMEDVAGAEQMLIKALETSPDSTESLVVRHNDLAVHYHRHDQLEEAIRYLQKAIELDPRKGPLYYNLANVQMGLGHVDKALNSYKKALDIDHDMPDAHLHLGFAYLLKGNLRRGWREMEWRWKIPVFTKTMLPTARWNGEKTDGAVILLSEQGMGDSVHFVRYAKQVAERVGKVIVYCPPTLARLMKTSPGVDEVHTWDTPIPEHESWAPMMSLPGIFRTELHNIPADVPYVSAADDDIKGWADKLGHLKGPKIGLSWKGNPNNERERTRAIDTQAVIEMVTGCAADFICLHKDRPDDIAEWPDNLHHFGDDFSDVADAAALMENLDLVLSIDTLATHLAGALNKELWILLAPVADWRYLLERDDNPWYPSARVLRRTQEEDWSAFMSRVGQELKLRFPDV